jgi:multiple sugar transport system substrate-binding protein
MKLRTSTIALAAALAFGVAATPLSAEELRFTVWTGSDAHLAMLNGIAESFKATHPDVTVKFETIPAADYTQKLTFQLAGGNPPDLGWMMEDAAPTFTAAGVLMDLGPTLRSAEGYDFDDFSEAALGLWVEGEKVYGVPFSTSPFMIFYNKDLFDAAGLEDPLALAAKGEWDMEKFREVAKTLTEETDAWGFEFKDGQGYDSRIMHALMPPIRAHGGDAWTDGECGFDDPEAVAAVQQLHDMVFVDKSVVPPGEQGDYFSGASAMTINQISRASRMAEAGFNWGIAPLPTGPGGESPVIGQAAIVVFERSPQKELAAEFVAHMTNKENVAIMAEYFPPARQSVLEAPAFTEANPLIPADQMAAVADAIATGKVLPSHERSPQILAAMAPRVDALWRTEADVETALQEVCAAIAPEL